MTLGHAMFFQTLATYLNHFAGRTATPVTAFGPMITHWPHTRARLMTAIGRDGDEPASPPLHLHRQHRDRQAWQAWRTAQDLT
jgi:hypothetical protein